jgi:hypothetical protein
LTDTKNVANYTLANGEIFPVDGVVWLDVNNADDVKVVKDVIYKD